MRLIFYAKWIPKQYTVSLNTENPAQPNPLTATVTYDQNFTLPILPRNGYTFHGWYSGINSSGVQYSDASGTMLRNWDQVTNTTLYAHWIIIPYSILYNLNGGTQSVNPSVYYVTSSVTLKNPTKSGYRFMGWYSNSSFTGNRIYSIPEDSTGTKQLHAKWAKIYTLVFNAGLGSSCSSNSGIVGRNNISAKIINCKNLGLIKYAGAASDNKAIAPRMGQIVSCNQ